MMWSRSFIISCTLLSMIFICSAVRKKERVASAPESPPASLAQAEDAEAGIAAKTGQGKFVVTIGDSYSSGAGIHTAHSDYEGGSCYRDSEGATGALYAAAHGMTFINKACGGAMIKNMPPYIDWLARAYPEETEKKWEGSVFTVTAGGNDLQTHREETWMLLIIRCVLTMSSCSRSSANEVANMDQVKAELTDLYSRMAQLAGKAKIRVLGYPVLLQKSDWSLCWGVPGISSTEAGWLDRLTDDFNGKIYSAVQAAKRANPGVDLEFASTRSYIKNGACALSSREINPILASIGEGTMSPATLHPTPAGYGQMLKALEASLA